MGAVIPRGIRNNNPGNIERGSAWLGLADEQSDERFAVFAHHIFGLRAMARTLRTYQRKHGVRTVFDAIQRWAPRVENPGLLYAKTVAARARIPAFDPTSFEDDELLARIMREMVRFENGRQPYDLRDYRIACELERAA